MKKVAVLVSGGGTNLQALIDAKNSGAMPSAQLAVVVSSAEGAYALQRAEQAGIPTCTLPRKQYASAAQYDTALAQALAQHDVDVVVLAGFLCILGPQMLQSYQNRIINVHPSLIPSFCGEGFYGLKVHEEALRRGVKISGATVHFVNEVVDGGAIIAQKAVEVLDGDTPKTLQERVMQKAEWVLLPAAVQKVCEDI